MPPGNIDRIAPTRRPSGCRVVMRQRWAELLFLHWPVPPDDLRPLLPPGLTPDTFAGEAFAGLVPFTMTGVRPVWAPVVPGLSAFHEVNVRTYVHRDGGDPGVFFFSLDAANPVAVRLARWLWKLPYHFARMRLARGNGDETGLGWSTIPSGCGPGRSRRRAGCVTGRPGRPRPPRPERSSISSSSGTCCTRPRLSARGKMRLLRGQVHHAPYPLQPAVVDELEESLVRAARIVRPEIPPPLAHYAREVRVEVFGLRDVTRQALPRRGA
jgi:uncharacterized protein YqjF (DUF2071 family)